MNRTARTGRAGRAGVALLGSACVVLSGCSVGRDVSPPPTPSVTSDVAPATVVVTYMGSVRFTHKEATFTSPPGINAAATDATRCQFYGLGEGNHGGIVEAEVRLLVPAGAVQSTMAAIWRLPGVTGTRVTAAHEFTAPPRGYGPAGEAVDCANAAGQYSG